MKAPIRQIAAIILATATFMSAYAEQWTPIGEGVWCEGLFCEVAGIDPGLQWNVEIEEDADFPGLYRLLPYQASSPVAAQLGIDTRNHVIIDATSPDRVFVKEFSAFGQYTVSHLVPENGWVSYAEYGTLSNGGTITFPAASFSVRTPAGWTAANTAGTFAVILPSGASLDITVADPSAQPSFNPSDPAGHPAGSLYYTINGETASAIRSGNIYICVPPAPAAPFRFLAR